MWRFRLIRFRLTLTYTLLLTAIFVLFSVGVFVTLHQVLLDNVYTRLGTMADKVVNDSTYSFAIQPGPDHPHIVLKVTSETVGGDQADLSSNDLTPSLLKTGFFDANSKLISGDKKGDPRIAANPSVNRATEKAITQGSSQKVTVSDKSGDSAVVIVPVTKYQTYGGTFVFAIKSSLREVESELDLLQRILAASALAVTMLSAAGSWFLTGRVLQPIGQITEKVRKITAQDLSQRLNIEQPDEIGRMANTFDGMIDRLQASFERQKRFTSDASHELRTPLAVMQADLSLALRRPRSAPDYRATLESAQEEVARLSRIVSDLLTLARLDTDVSQIAHDSLALDELVEMVVAGLRPLATDRSIKLTYAVCGRVMMIGDETRLKQVFYNLLDNAIAYTPDGGSIQVALQVEAGLARVTVRDTGIGIDPQDLPYIFDRFYRADEARSRNHDGTGLGLAIAHNVVQAHRGRFEVSSEPGRGTIFQVSLPLPAA